MRPAHVIEIATPKKYVLNGLWFGPKKPKRTIVWVHGLTSSAFSMSNVVESLVDKNTAVVTFNNRGFGTINSIKRGVGKKSKSILAGAAHEVFIDSADDIQGAIDFARKAGIKNIYLAGHSTGCQKSIYWAKTKKGGRGVRGVILVAPVSDYADALKRNNKNGRLSRLTKIARAYVKQGRKHELLPIPAETFSWGPFFCDAQRYLSLYTANSSETIFSYEQPKKNPIILKSAKVPVLVLWAQKDEFADRPAKEIATWFEKHLKPRDSVVVIPRVGHGFKGGERTVAKSIRDFMLKPRQ